MTRGSGMLGPPTLVIVTVVPPSDLTGEAETARRCRKGTQGRFRKGEGAIGAQVAGSSIQSWEKGINTLRSHPRLHRVHPPICQCTPPVARAGCVGCREEVWRRVLHGREVDDSLDTLAGR